jgi:hypothetical protein
VVHKKAASRVKDKALYKQLRKLGVSVKESTRVANLGSKAARKANTSAKSSHKKADRRGRAASSYSDWKVPELRKRAKHLGIKGCASMNKKQLIKALRAA